VDSFVLFIGVVKVVNLSPLCLNRVLRTAPLLTRSGWNLVDIFVVVISVVVMVVETTVSTKNLPWLHALRAAR
jgi:hypothetical protein